MAGAGDDLEAGARLKAAQHAGPLVEMGVGGRIAFAPDAVERPPDEGQGTPPAESFDMDRFLRVAAELGDELVDPPGVLPTDAGR